MISLSDIPQLVGLAVIGLAIAAVSWQARGCVEPAAEDVRAQTETDTVYAERTITRRDTVTQTVPTTRTIYERETDTVNVCRAEPEGFRTHGLITKTPIKTSAGGWFSSPTVTLTYWQPDSLRFEQATYDVPEPSWHLWPELGAQYHAWGFSARAAANLRWNRVHVYAGYELSRHGRGITAGVRLRPFTIDW